MYQEEYKRWLAADLEDADLKPELSNLNPFFSIFSFNFLRPRNSLDFTVDSFNPVSSVQRKR